jgi:outer membrane protein assembly factor BamB
VDRHGFLYAIDAGSGAVRWSLDYGPEWSDSFEMSRTTPTVAGERIYLISGKGRVFCADRAGKEVWHVDLFERFQGRNLQWGMAESPLLVNGAVICHPGGPDAAVAALDAATGATRWQSKGLGDRSAYCSPALLALGGRTQIVTHTENSVVGLDPSDGRVLWSHGHRNQYAVHPNTPVAAGQDGVLAASGYGYGAELIRVGAGGASRVWHRKELANHFQNTLLVDGRGYVCNEGGLQAFDPADGHTLYTVGQIRKAQIASCEAGILAYGDGTVTLLKIGPNGATPAGTIRVTFGNKQHWTTPVVANGALYIRHGRGLAAYNVRGAGR